MLVEKRLEELGIKLPQAAAPIANYVSIVQTGDLLFMSGAGPITEGKVSLTGALGVDVSVEQGYAAAREGAINIIAALKGYLGDLDRVEQIVKLLGFVRCSSDFAQQPAVINGASDLFVEVFGDKGRHARSAVGTNALPLNMPVEVEAVVRIK